MRTICHHARRTFTFFAYLGACTYTHTHIKIRAAATRASSFKHSSSSRARRRTLSVCAHQRIYAKDCCDGAGTAAAAVALCVCVCGGSLFALYLIKCTRKAFFSTNSSFCRHAADAPLHTNKYIYTYIYRSHPPPLHSHIVSFSIHAAAAAPGIFLYLSFGMLVF